MIRYPNVYQQNGYASRREYLECLAEDYGVDLATVRTLARALGSSEDFDGLVSALQDIEDSQSW